MILFNKTPLHLAIKSKNILIIKLLLDHPGIDINALDEDIFIKINS